MRLDWAMGETTLGVRGCGRLEELEDCCCCCIWKIGENCHGRTARQELRSRLFVGVSLA